MIEITLPYPPSVNNYKRVGRLSKTMSGKMYQQRVNSDATKRFYYEVWVAVNAYIAQNREFQPFPATIPIELIVGMHPPDKRRRDVDNILKCLLDSLQHCGLIKDDSQITRLVVEKKHIIANGLITVRINEL